MLMSPIIYNPYIYIGKKDNILIFSFNLFLKQPIGFLDFTWS